MLNRKTWSGLLLSICFAALLATSAAADEQKSKVIKIGAVLGLTGPATVWANSVRDGIALAADQTGPSGPKVELIVEDSKTEPKGSVMAYKKLVEVDKVDVVIGDVWDFITEPMIPLADKDKKLLISPTVVDASVQNKSSYFYTLGGQIRLARQGIDLFFEKNPDIHTAGIIFWDDPWGKTYLKEWKESAAAHHVTITAEMGLIDWGATYKTEVTKVMASKPDALLAPYNMEKVMRRLKELQLTPKLLTTSNILEVLATGELPFEIAEGAYFTDWSPSQKFIDDFKAKYGRLPIIEAQNGYDAFRAAYQSALASPNEPIKAAQKLQFEGISGKVDFTNGMSTNFAPATLKQVRNGKIVTVE